MDRRLFILAAKPNKMEKQNEQMEIEGERRKKRAPIWKEFDR